jgi:hypothetical protein
MEGRHTETVPQLDAQAGPSKRLRTDGTVPVPEQQQQE